MARAGPPAADLAPAPVGMGTSHHPRWPLRRGRQLGQRFRAQIPNRLSPVPRQLARAYLQATVAHWAQAMVDLRAAALADPRAAALLDTRQAGGADLRPPELNTAHLLLVQHRRAGKHLQRRLPPTPNLYRVAHHRSQGGKHLTATADIRAPVTADFLAVLTIRLDMALVVMVSAAMVREAMVREAMVREAMVREAMVREAMVREVMLPVATVREVMLPVAMAREAMLPAATVREVMAPQTRMTGEASIG
jgi:hypothetical protein